MMADQAVLLRAYHERCSVIVLKDSHEQLVDEFEKRGLKLLLGRWTVQEKRQLNANFVKFALDHAEIIGNPVHFVTPPDDDKERRLEVIRLKKSLNYVELLSHGLYRRCDQIKRHLRPTLDPLAVSNREPYSAGDLLRLKKLVDKYGKNWKRLSQKMGRSVVSLQSAHRNFFLHDGYLRQKLTNKQKKRMVKEMQKRYPNTDLTCEVVRDVRWNEIANKIGFMHGKYLHTHWEHNVKYIDEEGKLRMGLATKHPPIKLIRQMVRSIGRKQPTHMDAINWPKYFKKFSEYVGGIVRMRGLYSSLLQRFHLNDKEIGLPAASSQLVEAMEREKKLGFQKIWTRSELKLEAMPVIRWQQYHWAVSPELSHYVHAMPVMYQGYKDGSDEEDQECDQQTLAREDEEVW